jgi:hypothetical protein
MIGVDLALPGLAIPILILYVLPVPLTLECNKGQQHDLKSDNLQYGNMLCRWVDGTNDSLTKCLMFQVLFFS